MEVNELIERIPLELRNNIFFEKAIDNFKSILKHINNDWKLKKDTDCSVNFSEAEGFSMHGEYESEEFTYDIKFSYDEQNNICKFSTLTDAEEFSWITTLTIEMDENKENIKTVHQYFSDIIMNPYVIEKKSVFDVNGNELERRTVIENLVTNNITFEENIFPVKDSKLFYLLKRRSEEGMQYSLFIKQDAEENLNSKSFNYVTDFTTTEQLFSEEELKCIENLTEEEFNNILNYKYSHGELCQLFDRNSRIIRVLSDEGLR